MAFSIRLDVKGFDKRIKCVFRRHPDTDSGTIRNRRPDVPVYATTHL
ncbi:MAG: hypothetical protein PHS15_05535 [Clostridiaceae bacterium]|nr:hypothetical protein [Clostridiaceae bacterium]